MDNAMSIDGPQATKYSCKLLYYTLYYTIVIIQKKKSLILEITFDHLISTVTLTIQLTNKTIYVAYQKKKIFSLLKTWTLIFLS